MPAQEPKVQHSRSSRASYKDALTHHSGGKGKGGKGKGKGKQFHSQPVLDPTPEAAPQLNLDAIVQAVLNAGSSQAADIKAAISSSMGLSTVTPPEPKPSFSFSRLQSLEAQKAACVKKIENATASIQQAQSVLDSAVEYKDQLVDKLATIEKELDSFPLNAARFTLTADRLEWFEQYVARISHMSRNVQSAEDMLALQKEIASVDEQCNATTAGDVTPDTAMHRNDDRLVSQPVGHFEGGANLPWLNRSRGRSPANVAAAEGGRKGDSSRSPRRQSSLPASAGRKDVASW